MRSVGKWLGGWLVEGGRGGGKGLTGEEEEGPGGAEEEEGGFVGDGGGVGVGAVPGCYWCEVVSFCALGWAVGVDGVYCSR